ncbi:hypothetical protein GCM10023194_42050 [Planotetraspora phitsanulokensis]|uniref:Uncharacterized protein n=1 Tax=Planotetraspora phitsanulokensis TaxID=575192 RepID=A0A8J3U3A3_9ACTN|nr:hypothetical protein [Planotetraspora phitsanulokensis]GII37808.1 hypothetical protein Pph01_28110 [Planotetraspora phitsanulokensis]
MGPELQYQLIINRVADLQEEAANHRRARQAKSARKAHERGERRRGVFGKTTTS